MRLMHTQPRTYAAAGWRRETAPRSSLSVGSSHDRIRGRRSTSRRLRGPDLPGRRVDLLGAIAYGEISAFERLAEDAKLAPTLQDKLALAAMASAEFGQGRAAASTRIGELGVDPIEAMAPFVMPIDEFHRHTAPGDWLEGLIKAYVGDGLADDFYREIAAYLDADTRDLIVDSLGTPAATRSSSSTGCARRSTKTHRWAAGWRCGAAG